MPAIASGSPMPLFDRLAAGGTPSSPQGQDGAPLRDSVARELGRLLNTRSRLTAAQFHEADGTVIDYGVPDFSSRSLRSAADRESIAALVVRAITLFEPRLESPSARFSEADGPGGRPVLAIGGNLRVGGALARVTFELAAGGQTAAGPGWTPHG